MRLGEEGGAEPRSRLEAQIGLVLSGIPDVLDGLDGAAAHPPDRAALADVDYLHRERTPLVRDADVDRVAAAVPRAPVAHDNHRRRPTRLEFSSDSARSV